MSLSRRSLHQRHRRVRHAHLRRTHCMRARSSSSGRYRRRARRCIRRMHKIIHRQRLRRSSASSTPSSTSSYARFRDLLRPSPPAPTAHRLRFRHCPAMRSHSLRMSRRTPMSHRLVHRTPRPRTVRLSMPLLHRLRRPRAQRMRIRRLRHQRSRQHHTQRHHSRHHTRQTSRVCAVLPLGASPLRHRSHKFLRWPRSRRAFSAYLQLSPRDSSDPGSWHSV